MPDEFQPLDCVVVGGGISGLTCAFWLKRRGFTVQLLEASPHLGGSIQSVHEDGYTADGGPQSIIATPDFNELLNAAGLESFVQAADPQAARPYLVSAGALIPVPQKPPEILRSPLLSFGAKLRLLREPLIARRTAQSDESIASFVRRRAGSEVLDTVAAPFASGIFAGDATKLSTRSVFPMLVEFEAQHGSVVRGAIARLRAAPRNGSPATRRKTLGFRGGNDRLPAALGRRLGSVVRTGMPAKSMWQRGRWLELLVDDGLQTRIVARTVVVATAAHEAGPLLDLLDPPLRALLAAIPHPPVVQIAISYPKDAVGVKLDGFGFLVPRREGLRVLGCVFNSAMFADRCPEDHVLLTAFVGGTTDPDTASRSDAELARIVHDDLRRVLRLRDVAPKVVAGFRWPRAIPQYNLGHSERIAAIQARVAQIPHLFLTGNYFYGPAVPQCCKQAKATAELVIADLTRGSQA